MQNKIKKWIQETLSVTSDFVVEYPGQISHGDFTVNVALIESKKQGKNPKELAKEFVEQLDQNKLVEVRKIEVAGPGFINFFISKEYFADQIFKTISEGENFGHNTVFAGQKTIIEYTDPNPFKEFHIGHLMSNSIGESISRIIEIGGSDVKRLSYGGDVGLHVAKAIFVVLQKKTEVVDVKSKSENEQIAFWASAYVIGSREYEENAESKKQIDDLNKIIFALKFSLGENSGDHSKNDLAKSDQEINDLYAWGREVSIKHFKELFVRLDSRFTKNYWESEVVPDAMTAVEKGLQMGILEKSEGAVIFRGENYGLHTRVFVNSKGVPTYEAKELGLALKKFNEFSFDRSIVVTGNEQNDYFKVLLKAMDLLVPEAANKTDHIGHGMLRFASGKMSSRKGNIITGESLLDDVKTVILEKMADRNMSDEKRNDVAEKVAIGAIRFSILKQTIGKDIIFDMEKSISFEGDSGPYLQYSAVRAKSILKKAEMARMLLATKISIDWQTTNLERMLERFPTIVRKAGEEYAPSHIVTYLVQLASEFNSFYATHKIIDETDISSPYKLALTQSFLTVMTSGLKLLAIQVSDEM